MSYTNLFINDIIETKGGGCLENFKYSIADINEKDSWILIDCNNGEQYEDFVPFADFIKTINKYFSGKIIEVGEMCYKIEGLEPDMVFQWYDLFGIVVIYNSNKEEVLNFLKRTVII